MKHLLKILPVLLLVLNSFPTKASDAIADYAFTIHIGAFVKAKLADFKTIRPLGFIYAEKESNLSRVYMGDYKTEANAYKVLEKIKTKGYPDAFVTRRKLIQGQNVRMIQLAVEEASDDIDWKYYNQAGRLYAVPEGSSIKIMTGMFENIAAANEQLIAVKQAGFKDAFVKKLNKSLLHKVTSFEADTYISDKMVTFKEPAKEEIPEEYAEKQAKPKAPNLIVTSKSKEEAIPESYDEVVLTEKAIQPDVSAVAPSGEKVAAIKMPTIRKNVKRTSALELQTVLKLEKIYSGSIDGLYGPGTTKAWNTFKATNRQLKKYQCFSQHQEVIGEKGQSNILQHYINNLYQTPSVALKGLENAKEPIANAYRAYHMFVTTGKSVIVDELMNNAIQQAFKNKKLKNKPPFDYTATYTYKNIDQLILHLRYIQGTSEDVAAPVWLFQKHPDAATKAFASMTAEYSVQDCRDLLDWEELNLLQTIIEDLTPTEVDNKTKSQASSKLSQLILAPKALDKDNHTYIEGWNTSLWNGLNAWADKDPVLKKISIPLKATYFQSWVRLEDYFMDKGMKPREAKGLALMTLKTITEPYIGTL